MLTTASREYDQTRRLTALAVNDALRLSTRGPLVVAQSVQLYQAAAAALSMQTLAGILTEQGIDPAADATVVPGALLTGAQATAGMLRKAPDENAMLRLVETLVTDASRTTRAVDQATRPAVTGYVRSLRPPSCGRCAVLADRVYRHSQGFLRHPGCDCLMTPTDHTVGPSLVTDVQGAFDNGQIHGLSAADTEAIKGGADVGQVVNVRRKQAGLLAGSSVMVRAGRLTPQACLSLASTRAEQLTLLRRYGYLI